MASNKAFESSFEVIALALAHTASLEAIVKEPKHPYCDAVRRLLSNDLIKLNPAGTFFHCTPAGNFMMSHLFSIRLPHISYTIPKE